jgi:hypothetical protein
MGYFKIDPKGSTEHDLKELTGNIFQEFPKQLKASQKIPFPENILALALYLPLAIRLRIYYLFSDLPERYGIAAIRSGHLFKRVLKEF